MNGMDILKAVGDADDALLVEEYRPRDRRWISWAAGLTACLCVAAALVLTGSLPTAKTDTDTLSDGAAPPDLALQEQNTSDNSIHFQELTGEDAMMSASDIGLFREDLQRMSVEELESYYGTALRPEWLPEDLQGGDPDMNGVFQRAGEEKPYYDQNSLRYQDAAEDESQLAQYATEEDATLAQARSLTVTAAKERGIFYDVVIQSEEDARADGALSTVNGREMLLYQYTSFGADYLGARYHVGQTEVEVTGKNLTQEEFIRILESMT